MNPFVLESPKTALGIMAGTGSNPNPVVGVDVEGIRETILDIGKYGDKGTWVLVPAQDPKSLATALVSIIMVVKIDESSQHGQLDKNHVTQKIPSKLIKKRVSVDLLLGSRIREN